PDVDVEVAARPVVRTDLALTAKPEHGLVVDAGRNLRFHAHALVHAAAPSAAGARVVDDLARAVAHVACRVDAEEMLLEAHRTCALAARAGLWLAAGLRAAALAVFAGFEAGECDLGFLTAEGILKADRDRDFEIASVLSARAPSAPAHLLPA